MAAAKITLGLLAVLLLCQGSSARELLESEATTDAAAKGSGKLSVSASGTANGDGATQSGKAEIDGVGIAGIIGFARTGDSTSFTQTIAANGGETPVPAPPAPPAKKKFVWFKDAEEEEEAEAGSFVRVSESTETTADSASATSTSEGRGTGPGSFFQGSQVTLTNTPTGATSQLSVANSLSDIFAEGRATGSSSSSSSEGQSSTSDAIAQNGEGVRTISLGSAKNAAVDTVGSATSTATAISGLGTATGEATGTDSEGSGETTTTIGAVVPLWVDEPVIKPKHPLFDKLG